ncbi:MAG: S1 RNA-binding domain-containing protein [Chloroflexi bacterium]|nr:S1 RNA-binding domain-containing protein [Chloroflexota bacterium]
MNQETLQASTDTPAALPVVLQAPLPQTTHPGETELAANQTIELSPTPPPVQRSGWEIARESYTQGHTLELNVVGYNRGGLLIDLGDVRGFVPASQLSSFTRRATDEERMLELAQYIGKTLRLKVIELDRAHNRLILSERIAKTPVSRSEQLLNSIQPGQTLTGTIRNVTDFGAFVDLGGVEGLIHVSEMSWQRVAHPRDVCTAGAQVQVYVIDVNREQRRIGLSLKRLTLDPWALAAEHYKPGDIVPAVITNVVSFGAFARLPEGIEGLIHTSELAEGNFLHPNDVVHEGDTVHVRVMNVDPVRQRVGLTLRKNARAHPPTSAPLAGPIEYDDAYWNSLAEG